jgi:hypothetical protein
VQLDTRRVSGLLEKPIFVQLDRPRREEVRLIVKANIRTDLILAPETLVFGRVKQGSSQDASVTVLFAGKANCKILDAKCASEYVKAQVEQLPEDSSGISYRVTAHLLPGLPVGSWYTTVWLRTDNPSLPRFPIGVTVEVRNKDN